MRKTFAKLLYDKMAKDKNIYVLTADLGYMMWDDIKRDFPDRFYNCGSAEQLMISMAVGMTYEGKIPVCYSITPFLLCRPFEMIRNYINDERAPVKLVGCGRDNEYLDNGFSHWAYDDKEIMDIFDNIEVFIPELKSEVSSMINKFLYENRPGYMNLSKVVYSE